MSQESYVCDSDDVYILWWWTMIHWESICDTPWWLPPSTTTSSMQWCRVCPTFWSDSSPQVTTSVFYFGSPNFLSVLTFFRVWRGTGMSCIISTRASLSSRTQLPRSTAKSVWSWRWSSWNETLTSLSATRLFTSLITRLAWDTQATNQDEWES